MIFAQGVYTSFGRFFGYHRDTPGRRIQKPLRAHPLFVGAGKVTLSGAASLEHFEAPIMDQGQSGSCTGHGTSQGLCTAFAAQGDPLGFVPSQLTTYTDTRALERGGALLPGQDLPALSDTGAMPADVMVAIGRYGIRPMRVSASPDGRFSDAWSDADLEMLPDPKPPANLNAEPLEDDLVEQASKLIVGEYRIDEKAADMPEQVASAIELARAPVGIGAFVDSAVMQWSKGQAPLASVNLNDSNGGGHWIVITSYRLDGATGKKIFRLPNSWGLGYGDAGHFEVTEDWLRQAAWDLYPLTVRRAA